MSLRALGAVGTALLFAACSSTSSNDTPTDGDAGTITPGPKDPVQTGPTPAGCGRNTTPCDIGGTCDGAQDCKSGACRDTKCAVVSPADGVKDGDETDIDCGGTKAPACSDGKGCGAAADCSSQVCTGAKCQAPSATDKVKNGDETGTDCGGSKAPKCNAGFGCKADADCNNLKCDPVAKICADPAHSDGLLNGDETGVDCGGPTAPNRCGTGEGCNDATDCNKVLCTANVCAMATHDDGIKNLDETGIDCGGPTANRCATGGGCVANSDCDNAKCDTAVTHACLAPSHTDGIKNLDETGIDCGGTTGAARCATGQGCGTLADCNNVLCTGNVCATATHNDGLKNAGETDIDCGGGAAKCAVGQNCAGADSDCTVACNYNNKCVEARSCKTQHGGDTCGPNGNESCCVSLSNGGAGANAANIDKYNITAGRFRQMVNATGGNIRGWITTPGNKPSWWVDGWTQYLPNKLDNGGASPNFDGLYQEVGPNVHGAAFGGSNEGCSIKGTGARTYWIPDAINTRMGDSVQYSQAQLDDRSLNCVTGYLIQAFCAWDGGTVPTLAQWNLAWGSGTYPWGNTGRPAGYRYAYDSDINGGGVLSYLAYANDPNNPNSSDYHPSPYTAYADDLKWANFDYNYWGGLTRAANDYSIYIAPPGRFPNGNSPTGHADMAGNVFNSLQLTVHSNPTASETNYNQQWSRSGSWQGHPIPYGAFTGDAQNKYWAKGGRCAH